MQRVGNGFGPHFVLPFRSAKVDKTAADRVPQDAAGRSSRSKHVAGQFHCLWLISPRSADSAKKEDDADGDREVIVLRPEAESARGEETRGLSFRIEHSD
ncbi:hypothetical protein L596_005108 [Steinernema carpocapsae]|uniref:Uncharacterized protein n=1 Tax=Steinernema carpocapsae TaxID=34508 RepID=A0A4U8UXY5_STECR|nr:hypothetical protein L596_005108 [Steinernema carpocapsae]